MTNSVQNPWFPGVRPIATASCQLFCFPFAGGGASAFLRWRNLVAPDIELWPIEYPAHESRMREQPVAGSIELAALIAEQIAAVVDRPFAFFGHSMGSMLAFETARRLREDHGLAPKMMFVSGYDAPQLRRERPPVRDLPEAEFRDELRLYGGTPEEVLSDEGFMAFLSPLVRRDLGMCELHVHAAGGELDCPMVAFAGYADVIVPWHRLLAWSRLIRGPFRAHMLPGGHFFLTAHTARITGLLRRYLMEGVADDTRLPPPERDEAHLWLAAADQPAPVLAALRDGLAGDERARADAFARDEDRARSVVARGALRDLLRRYTGVPARALAFTTTAVGKPACVQAGAIGFNISHSGDKVLLGFASGQAIGVDVEEVRDGVYTPQLASQVMTPDELHRLAEIAPARRDLAFFDLWVRKEAWLKRTGHGFTTRANTIEVGMSPHMAPASGRHAALDERVQSCTLAPDYVAAVAAEQPIRMVTIRAWSPPATPGGSA